MSKPPSSWFRRGVVPQEPTAPAVAYSVVAEILPDSYFDRRPPADGFLFTVTGTDNRPTSWFIPSHLGPSLEQLLRANRQIKSVFIEQYDDTQEAA